MMKFAHFQRLLIASQAHAEPTRKIFVEAVKRQLTKSPTDQEFERAIAQANAAIFMATNTKEQTNAHA